MIKKKCLRDSKSETGYLLSYSQHGLMKLQRERLPSVNTFKYIGSVVDGSVGCGKEFDARITHAWKR